MPSKRDPRKDPKTGDEVQVGNHHAKVTIVQRSIHYELWCPDGPPIYRIPILCRVSKPRWRQQMKNAEVIHAAD